MRRSPRLGRLIWLLAGPLLAACGGGPSAAAPTIAPADAGVHCAAGDHGLNEPQLGWSFCYPGTWKFRERVQQSLNPAGVDDTFDIVDVPPSPNPDQGKFGFLIIGTYVRGGSPDLASWVAKNVGDGITLEPIKWGNAKEAAIVSGSHRRYALTANHVVLLDPRGADGNLDLDGQLSSRLGSWNFQY